MLGEGRKLAEVARHLEVSEQTHHRWRKQFGGMKADDAKRVPRDDKSRESRSGRGSGRRSPTPCLPNHEYEDGDGEAS
jgi:transposase-like protein